MPADVSAVLEAIAASGLYWHDWDLIKHALAAKLDESASKMNKLFPDCPERAMESFREKRSYVISALEAFDEAPFTVQRLCELVTAPQRQYASTAKWLASVDRMLSVTSTQAPNDPVQWAVSAAITAQRDGAAAAAAKPRLSAASGDAGIDLSAPVGGKDDNDGSLSQGGIVDAKLIRGDGSDAEMVDASRGVAKSGSDVEGKRAEDGAEKALEGSGPTVGSGGGAGR